MSRWWSEGVPARRMQAWRARWQGGLRTWREPAWVSLAPQPHAACTTAGVPRHDEALQTWRLWCEAHPGQQVRVGLSARWLLSTALPAPTGPRSAWRQAQDQAIARWADLLGLDEAAWHARWVSRVAAWPQGTLLCAVPRALVDDLLAVAAHHRVRPRWIGPWWARGLRQWLQAMPAQAPSAQPRALAMREPGWAVHAETEGAALVHLWAAPDAGEAAADAGSALWWSDTP